MLQSYLSFSLRLFSFSSLQVHMSVLCIGVHECSYLCGSICVCSCAHSHVGGDMCGHSGLMLNFSPLLFHLIHPGKGSPSNPELTDRASFPRQLALGSLCFDFLRLELTGD